jgi:hypothetical protein
MTWKFLVHVEVCLDLGPEKDGHGFNIQMVGVLQLVIE